MCVCVCVYVCVCFIVCLPSVIFGSFVDVKIVVFLLFLLLCHLENCVFNSAASPHLLSADSSSDGTDDGSSSSSSVNKSEYTPIISNPQPVAEKTDSYGALPF